MSNVRHLENLCVVHVDFDIWSGQTRLSAEDIQLGLGGEIPPAHIAQLGTKRICDPAKLKGFSRLKTATRRLLLRYGMPFMNGFAVPESRSAEICDQLDNIAQEFAKLKSNFLSSYGSAIDEWIRDNPVYENAIRTGTIPMETVEKRIGFEYTIFMIQPAKNVSDTRLSNKIGTLGDDLLASLAEDATQFFEEKLAGREECAVMTRITLGHIRDKLDGLSFLNSNLIPLVDLLDETLKGYEAFAGSRNISGAFFYKVMAVVLIMTDRKRVEAYASGNVDVADYSQALFSSQTIPPVNSNPLAADKGTKTDVNQVETNQAKPASTITMVGIDEIDEFFSQFESAETEPVNAGVSEPVIIDERSQEVIGNVDESELQNSEIINVDESVIVDSTTAEIESEPVKKPDAKNAPKDDDDLYF